MLVASFTGIPLLFRSELDRALFPELYTPQRSISTAASLAAVLSVDSIRQVIAQDHPGYTLASVSLPSNESNVYMARLRKGPKGIQSFYRTDGKLLGDREESTAPLRVILELHRAVLLGDTGRAISFFIAVLFILSTITGLILNWKTIRRNFRRYFTRKPHVIPYRDLHGVVGISAMVFCFIWSVSGSMMQWESVKRVAGIGERRPSNPPLQAQGDTTAKISTMLRMKYASLGFSIDSVIEASHQFFGGFEPAIVTFSEDKKEPLSLRGRIIHAQNIYGDLRPTVTVTSSGSISRITDPEKAPLGDKIQMSASGLHEANYGGLPIRILYSLFSLAPGTLAISGCMMYLRRKKIVK